MPKYETAEDLRRQRRAAAHLAYALDVFLVETDAFQPYDYDAENEPMLVEIKVRTHSRRKYPTVLVGADKLDAIVRTARRLRKRVVIVFEFTDGVDYVEVDTAGPVRYKERMITRRDRGVTHRCYLVPLEETTRIPPVPPEVIDAIIPEEPAPAPRRKDRPARSGRPHR